MELFERGGYLQELTAGLDEARSGAGSLVLVSGEAGIGKTTLVEQFVRERGRASRVLWGVCDALFTPRPLGPLHDMAAGLRGGLPELLAAEASPSRLFPAFFNELQNSSAIVVFEDVHWADEATLDLLRYLGRRFRRTSALLVITFRDDELGPAHPLRIVLGDIPHSAGVRRILLPPLSANAVRALVGPRDVDADALFRRTGGNPFYVTEVLANPGAEIPASVREAVLARAARLSPAGRAAMEAAAVVGLRVEPWLLEAMLGTGAQAVDECLNVGVLLVQDDLLAFRHALTRETILAAVSPQRRRVLHQQALAALEQAPQAEKYLARLTHHAKATGDQAAVLEYALPAARQAAASRSHREAAALYALALPAVGRLSLEQQAVLYEEFARESDVIDRREEALAAQRKAIEIWHQLGNSLREATNYFYLVAKLIGMGRNAEAEQAAAQALSLFEASGTPAHLAFAYQNQATLRLFSSDHAEAIQWIEKKLALPGVSENPGVIIRARTTLGAAWMFLDYARGCELLEALEAECRRMGEVIQAANVLVHLATHSAELHRFDRAEGYLETGLARAVEADVELLRLLLLAEKAYIDLARGRWTEAAETAGAVLRRPGISAVTRSKALIPLARVRARRGDPGVMPILDEALRLAERAGTLLRLGPVRAARAEAAWLAGDPARTRAEARAAFDLAAAKRHPWFGGELAYWRWRAGDKVPAAAWLAAPYRLQITGRWQAAASGWARLGCVYEQARALSAGSPAAQAEALRIFERLGAQPDADAVRQMLQTAGIRGVPRRPRAATRENPFGLTRRQLEVAALLIKGLSNAEIAAQLHISLKTTDHHVSAILSKLGVHTREQAAALAGQHPYFASK
jgi:DNA-binding CsgD family transcriptional regulator